MRALIAVIIVLALLFVGFGTYFTFQKQREAQRALQQARMAERAAAERVLGEEAAAARRAEERRLADRGRGDSPIAGQAYDFSVPAHGLLLTKETPVDEALASVCAAFAKQDETARQATRATLSQKDLYTLLHFANRSGVFAMRAKSVALVERGWIALAMVDVERIDWRDLIVAIGLADHATRRIGGDTAEQIDYAKPLATPKTATILENYLNREPYNRKLSAWNRAEVVVRGQLGLVGTDRRKYEPRRNLLGIGLAISDSLDPKRFARGELRIATSIAPAWFKGGRDDELRERLARAHGTMTIQATYRRPQNGFLFVFLCEAASVADCDWLAAQTLGKLDGGAVAAARTGELLCVVVSRALTTDTPAPDTPQAVALLAQQIGGVVEAEAGK